MSTTTFPHAQMEDDGFYPSHPSAAELTVGNTAVQRVHGEWSQRAVSTEWASADGRLRVIFHAHRASREAASTPLWTIKYRTSGVIHALAADAVYNTEIHAMGSTFEDATAAFFETRRSVVAHLFGPDFVEAPLTPCTP